MKKTLAIELREYHDDLSEFMYFTIYEGELRDWHTLGCAFNDSNENRCDCVLLDAYKLIKHWKRP
jgi:hypothetical protein